MAILVECPNCKKRLSVASKVCESRSGKGCGAKIPFGTRIYWVSYRDPNGRTKQKRIGPSKTAAENFERKTRVEVTEGRYIDKKETPKVLIKDFLKDDYIPWCKANNRGYESSKRFFVAEIEKQWGSKFLHELTDEDIERYKWQMLKAKTKVMFNRVLATISHMYTIAVEFGKVEHSPIRTAKKRIKEKGRLRYLMPDEVQTLISACPDSIRPIVVTAVHTGMRKGEILGLRLGEHVDLEKRMISLSETKNDEPRHIPINDTLFDELVTVSEGKRPGDFLFVKKNGKSRGGVRVAFNAALSEAGIKDFTFHDLRHTTASNLVMNGVDLYTVKEILGHKDIKMTMKYAHLSPEHKTHAIRALDKIFSGKSTLSGSQEHFEEVSGSPIGSHE